MPFSEQKGNGTNKGKKQRLERNHDIQERADVNPRPRIVNGQCQRPAQVPNRIRRVGACVAEVGSSMGWEQIHHGKNNETSDTEAAPDPSTGLVTHRHSGEASH